MCLHVVDEGEVGRAGLPPFEPLRQVQLRELSSQGGIQALDRGDSSKAAQLLARALELAPGYEPAKRALTRLRTVPEASEKSPDR